MKKRVASGGIRTHNTLYVLVHTCIQVQSLLISCKSYFCSVLGIIKCWISIVHVQCTCTSTCTLCI